MNSFSRYSSGSGMIPSAAASSRCTTSSAYRRIGDVKCV